MESAAVAEFLAMGHAEGAGFLEAESAARAEREAVGAFVIPSEVVSVSEIRVEAQPVPPLPRWTRKPRGIADRRVSLSYRLTGGYSHAA